MKKLLIIDDEEFFCRVIKRSLEAKTDFEVLTATQSDEGMRLAKAEKPDIILLDIMMPGMYGTEVAQALSENPVTRSIPIIFITAMINEDDIERGAGISSGKALIAKPVKVDELIDKINAVLSS